MKRSVIISLFILFAFPALPFAQEVPADPFDVSPLLINETIPDVEVRTIENEAISLHDVVKTKPTMFVFYRGGWCPYCSRHMVELKQIEEEILEIGYQIIAISVDRPEALKETLTENELPYTLLSDSPADALKGFGIAYKVDDATVERYKSVGIHLEDHQILPAPAVYIVDQEGTVKFQYVNPNYRERINGDVLLAAAKAYL
ncbi:MAG: AhpC/TSA family protein [Balneolales bacterium]|nr:AhpC/TSA family protein [Balneolales bacterium]